MRDLHVVGLTPDGQHLLLAGSSDATKASHRIAVDAHFEAALRGQRVGDAAPTSVLSPRDIQARLRAGATVEEVASYAGMPVSRVQRFAGPVFSEREEVLRKVYRSHQHGRRGTSAVTLESAVAGALEQTAFAKPETLDWTAYRRPDGTWVAKVSIIVRGRRKSAEWALASDGTTVRPLDPWASSLGHVEAAAKPVKKAPAKAAVAKKVPAAKVSGSQLPPAKSPAKSPVAKSPAKSPVKVSRARSPR